MKIANEKTLDLFRGPGVCDWCKKLVRSRDPHHILSRGAGQVDIRANIAALCTTFAGGLNCHHAVHTGEIEDDAIFAVVAAREDALQGDIESVIYLIRRLDKNTTVDGFKRAVMNELNFGARRLALRELESFEHLLRRAA